MPADASAVPADGGGSGAPDRPLSGLTPLPVADDERGGAGGGGGDDEEARDPEAGLTGGPAEGNGGGSSPAPTVKARPSPWRKLAHWLSPQPAAAKADGGGRLAWLSPGDEEHRSEEQVLRALLCLMDAGEKRRPNIAVGPPGKEAAPMRWYHLR